MSRTDIRVRSRSFFLSEFSEVHVRHVGYPISYVRLASYYVFTNFLFFLSYDTTSPFVPEETIRRNLDRWKIMFQSVLRISYLFEIPTLATGSRTITSDRTVIRLFFFFEFIGTSLDRNY